MELWTGKKKIKIKTYWVLNRNGGTKQAFIFLVFPWGSVSHLEIAAVHKSLQVFADSNTYKKKKEKGIAKIWILKILKWLL